MAVSAEVAVSAEIVDAELVEDAPPCQGHVIIEWPLPAAKAGQLGALAGCRLLVVNAEDEKPVLTVMQVEIHAAASSVVTADLTMWAGPDGKPLMDGSVMYYRGDELITGTFRFWVSGIRNYGSQQEIRERLAAPGVHQGSPRVVYVA